MNSTIIGIDNGSTGSIGIVSDQGSRFLETPSKKSLLGKANRVIMRVDHHALSGLFHQVMKDEYGDSIHAYLERPYTGQFLNAMLPGQRAFEATLVCLEIAGIAYTVVDSKEWQKSILGDKIKGSAALKEASKQRGLALFPNHADVINSHGDADGLLLAHHYYHHHA